MLKMTAKLASQYEILSGQLRLLHEWNKRTLATWWLWIPLLFAIIALTDGQDRRKDMYAAALANPRFTAEGVVDNVGYRRRWMQLKTREGTRRISCEAGPPRIIDYFCLPSERFPMKIKVELIDYYGVWLILSATDENNVKILSRERHLERLKRQSMYSTSQTPITEFFTSFLIAFMPGLILSLFALRRRRKIQAEDIALTERS